MSEEFISRLYMPFEQATASTASKFGGTGLGMAITQNLVSLLGGMISVKSKEGRGTEFTVELPFGLSGRQTSRELSALDPLKVLVVDDDPGTCEHASLLLGRMGPARRPWISSCGRVNAAMITTFASSTGRCPTWTAWRQRGASAGKSGRTR